MGKGIIFFACSCCILVLTIVNLSIGPIINQKTQIEGTENCEQYKDLHDAATGDDTYGYEWEADRCVREKGMHDMEYTSFIFDIVIGFVCSLIGLLHIFEVKKDFVSNTGLIGLICGVIGFVLSFVYVIFNGLVYTSYYDSDIYKTDGDGIVAELSGNKYKCKYFDKKGNTHALYAKYSDLGKKQYNYDKDLQKKILENINCIVDFSISSIGSIGSIGSSGSSGSSGSIGNWNSENLETLCADEETFDIPSSIALATPCKNLYAIHSTNFEITNKDKSDRFLTTLILSLFVCLANIGLALFGFLLFRTPGDF